MKQIADIAGAVVDPTFEAFWKDYPRKTDKAGAAKSFDRLSKAEQAAAIQGAEYHARCNPQWRNPKLIPHATTFLNRKRWQDEIVEDRDAKERVHSSISTGPAMMVWKAMTQMFGKQWIDRHGESPMPVWVTQLSKVSEGRIKRGLRECADSGAEFPPSLPAFLAMCRRQSDDLPEFKSLPRPWPDEEVAEPAFDELKKILRY